MELLQFIMTAQPTPVTVSSTPGVFVLVFLIKHVNTASVSGNMGMQGGGGRS
jgi:hypothetical protein